MRKGLSPRSSRSKPPPASWPRRKAAKSPASEITALDEDVAKLRLNLEALLETADTVFFGRFPLVRPLHLDHSDDSQLNVTYNLLGTGQREAARAALKKAAQSLPSEMLSTVVLVERDAWNPRNTPSWSI